MIRAVHLSKEFEAKGTFAVRDLSFQIGPGESVAFLGPNGAGKSTTIKMLCGILTPTSGEAWVSGERAGSKNANRSLGLVFGTRSQLFMHMTVGQCLDLIAEIYFVTGRQKRERIASLAAIFDIQRFLPRRVRSLSLGERMRCELVAALLHRPRILLADEPTIGLDVIAKNQLRELILRWQREEKTTFMLTSHDLSDVEVLCDRCLLIDKGEKRFDGTLDALKGDLSDVRRVQITVSDAGLAPFDQDRRVVRLPSTEGFLHDYEIRTREIAMADLLARLSAHYGDRLQDIQISEVSLEEVLSHRYGGRK